MSGLQLINLLTGQQPGQSLAGLPGGSGAGGNGGGGLFQATLGGLLTEAATSANAPVPGLGVGLLGAANETAVANAGGASAQKGETSGDAAALLLATNGDAAASTAEGAGAAIDGLVVASTEHGANTAEALVSIEEEIIAEALLDGELPSLVDDLDAVLSAGLGGQAPATATEGDAVAGAAATNSDGATNHGLSEHKPSLPGATDKASKAQGLLHASPNAIEAVLASAAASSNPVFSADAGTAGTPTDSASTSSSSTPLVAPAAGGDPAATKQAAALKGQQAAHQGQDNASGKEAGAGGDGSTGNGTQGQAQSGNGHGGNHNQNHSGTANTTGAATGQNANVAGQTIGLPDPALTNSRAQAAGLFVPIEGAVANDPFFGFNWSADTSASAQTLGSNLGAVHPTSASGISLASATGANAPGASPSFAHTPHLAASQVGIHVTRAVVNGDSEFNVRLNPPELGRVSARLEFTADSGVRASFIAESRETLALLQRDAHVLEKALADAGIDARGQDLSFSLRQDSDGRADNSFESGNDEFALADWNDGDTAIDVTPQVVRQVISDSAVDITI